MENERNEQTIYLKDLLFVALKGWRRLLAAGLVLAAVFGALKLYRGVQEINEVNTLAQAQLSAAQIQYAQDMEAAADAIHAAEEERDDYKEHLKESLLVNLNEAGYFVAETTYLVRGTGSNIEKILGHYAVGLQKKAVVARIGEAVDEEPDLICEVYRVEQNEELGTLRIVCFRNRKEDAQKLLSALMEEVAALEQEVALFRGKHDLLTVHQDVSKQADDKITRSQQEAETRLEDLEYAITEAKARKAAMAEPVMQYTPRSQAVKPAVKFAVAGGVLGIALMVVMLWLRHMSAAKVYSARTLVNATNVKLLGCVGSDVRNPVDRCLLQLEGRAVKDQENRIRLLAADIRNRCGENKQLLVTGDGDAESRKVFLETLAAQLPGVQLLDEGSLLWDAEAVEALYAQNMVLLIEQCDSSTYAGVNKEMDMVADYGKTLIGCILLRG